MASIRRTQSPYHHNGGATPFSAQSPPHKLLPTRKSPPPYLSAALRRLYSQKTPQTWRLSLYRYLLFFALGFLLGLSPFGLVDDVPTRDFAFDRAEVLKQESIVKLGLEKEKLEVPSDSDRVGVPKLENIVIDSVKFGVEVEKLWLNYQKQLIIITPTYNRALQAYFLNRLGQVLRLMPPPLMWIVVEMNEPSVETAGLLRKMGVMYRHLVCKKNSNNVKDRGVHQRNTALEHIERHRLDGIVYFADDDNVYSLELFESLREIRRFGTWPIAMLAQSKAKAILEGPVCDGSKVIGWHTNEKSKRLRRFHVDMSGFAFNSTILWDPKRWQRATLNPIRQLDTVKEGFQETTFIEQVVEDEYQMEGSAPSCLKIMNWHLHLEGSKFSYPRGWLLQKNLDAVLQIV